MASFRIGMVALPSHISKEIAQVAKQTPKREVSDGLQRINAFLTAGGSGKLKQKAAERGLVATSDGESVPAYSEKSQVVAYTCARMVSSYASIYSVFSHISKKVPLFTAKSLLDFGAGPATGYLAFKSVWPESNLEKYIAIDKSNQMLQIGKQLTGATLTKDCPDQEQSTVFLFENFLQPQIHKADLVICAFTLSELHGHVNVKDLVRTLWANTVDTLVIIDRGTPIGFELVANARTQILKEESLSSNDIVHIVAPCPHEKECPVLQNQNQKTHSYCSFSQRIQLDATAKRLKNKRENIDDSKFSYVIISRRKRQQADAGEEYNTSNCGYSWPKIVRPPLKRQGHVIMDICTSDGSLERRIISKSSPPPQYQSARKSYWGDCWPFQKAK